MRACLVVINRENITELATAAKAIGAREIELWTSYVEPMAAPLLSQALLPALTELYVQREPQVLVFESGPMGEDLAACAGAALRTVAAIGVTGASAQDGRLTIRKRVCGMQLDGVFQVKGFPFIFSVAQGCFEGEGICQDTFKTFELPAVFPPWCENYRETRAENAKKLEDCKRLIVAGRGVGSKHSAQKAERLAGEIGAEIAGSRVAAQNGWISMDAVVGASGTTVAPDVCVVLGASGSTPFMAGIEKSKVIFTVNTDPDALIYHYSDYGLIEDCNAVVDAMLEIIEDRRRRKIAY